MKAPSWLKAFNRSQRNALLVLITLQALAIALPRPGTHHQAKTLHLILDTLCVEDIFPEGKKNQQQFVRKEYPQQVRVQRRQTPTRNYTKIDINAADSTSWLQFRGIGPVLAGRIIKFRDKLGGFVRPQQVAETYGLPDSVYRSIAPYLYLEQPHRTIAINEADIKTLIAHPYIDYPFAVALVRLREKTGKLEQAEQLFEKLPEWAEQLQKIIPYISW